MSELTVVPARPPVRGVIIVLDVAAKAMLLLLLMTALRYPELGHLEGKGATARAVGYPLAAFIIPAAWFLIWRRRVTFPWLVDLLVTLTCFTDTLGNRMDLYDTVRRFDDLMHFVNTGVLTAAFVLLTLSPRATRAQVLERSLAFGVTAALVWEIAEYYAFLSTSGIVDRYADTLGDMALGSLGSVVAGQLVYWAWQHHHLLTAGPQPLPAYPGADERPPASRQPGF
ncbi:hypothetical protein GL325_02775 [Aeromicrobium sp. 636]|uniref:Uncharacterized protein n=1 Tax=Aeromicrobium senzhongii TaxID=2663859 RepID=A0A8I0ES79_9ACTN|nr:MULTISPECIES: hypothetical protein [Aeromicrobium]MBC9225240.1 hypothetical protein [Aeromicrobium senzhongii]MCQ3997350.1 hypothetical protein [Aeromicrobium sp. 636]